MDFLESLFPGAYKWPAVFFETASGVMKGYCESRRRDIYRAIRTGLLGEPSDARCIDSPGVTA